MPCYEEQSVPQRVEYRNGVDPSPYLTRISTLQDRVSWLEAALCALINEMDREEISNRIILSASRNGKINLLKFWEEHSKEDEARLLSKFNSMSEHEKSLIKKMIKEEKI